MHVLILEPSAGVELCWSVKRSNKGHAFTQKSTLIISVFLGLV